MSSKVPCFEICESRNHHFFLFFHKKKNGGETEVFWIFGLSKFGKKIYAIQFYYFYKITLDYCKDL